MGATTLRKWVGEFTKQTGELVDTIVLGWRNGWGDYTKDKWPEWDQWAQVVNAENVPAEIWDCEFDDGFGGNESPNLCAWSHSWVLFSDNYDGAEDLRWVPRHPIDHEPIRPGGG